MGTQQHRSWELETSYKTGLKSITADDGRVYTFPFSMQADGAPIVPSAVRVVTPVISGAIPWAGKPPEAGEVEKPFAEAVDEPEMAAEHTEEV